MQINGNRINYSNRSNKEKKTFKIKKSYKILLIITAVILFVVILISSTLNSISPRIVAYCEARVRSMSTQAINRALFLSFSATTYSDIIRIDKNDRGEIVLLQANSLLINEIAKSMSSNTEFFLSTIVEQGIDIPLGTLSNMTIFSGKGPNINIVFTPLPTVACVFKSEFETAGINQTRHKIYLEILTSITIIIPTATKIIDLTNQILICENIIVGQIPETFLQMGKLN